MVIKEEKQSRQDVSPLLGETGGEVFSYCRQ